MTAMIFGLMSCGNSKSPASAVQEEVEMVEVEEVIDEPEADTSAVVTRGGSESGGFGRCLQSGCYCKAFEGRGQTCRNCGHAYSRHY